MHIFRHDCQKVSIQLQELGKKVIENLAEENVANILLVEDFKNRTVRKIIASNSYEKLFASVKVSVLLEEIWIG